MYVLYELFTYKVETIIIDHDVVIINRMQIKVNE
jgi:hypothetical protein